MQNQPQAVLGDDEDSFAIRGIGYESERPTDPDWLAVDLAVVRSGALTETTSPFITVYELYPLACWLDRLSEMASDLSEPASREAPYPDFYFDAAVQIEAVSWGKGSARLRFRWHGSPPWEEHDLSSGEISHYVQATVPQLSVMSAVLKEYDARLPQREGGRDWQTPLFFAVLALVVILLVLGATTVAKWLIGLFQ